MTHVAVIERPDWRAVSATVDGDDIILVLRGRAGGGAKLSVREIAGLFGGDPGRLGRTIDLRNGRIGPSALAETAPPLLLVP